MDKTFEEKYIDAEKLRAYIERRMDFLKPHHGQGIILTRVLKDHYNDLLSFITSLQQEQPQVADASKMDSLEYWLRQFGMPEENIENCITQIAQGYGACRYLEGIQLGAEAVNELAKQEQPEVDLDEAARHVYESWMGGTMDDVRRDMVELGRVLNARKGE